MNKLLTAILVGIVSFNTYAGDWDDLFDFSDSNSNTSCLTVGTHQECQIYMLEGIKDPSAYLDIYKQLAKAKQGDTVYIHLAGMGGNGDGLVYLLNAINTSPAEVISVVDGAVASAHAVLAVATKKTIINGDGWVLFHNISLTGMVDEVCRQETGSDRGLAAYTKCMELMPKLVSSYNETIKKYVYPVMSPDEIKQYEEGHDIVISTQQLKDRLQLRDQKLLQGGL